MKQRIRWLVLHGLIRGVSFLAARRGDPQGRLLADPAVRADPAAFYEELRARGPMVSGRRVYITVDHAIAHELLRSDDFRVTVLGAGLPKALRWVERRTNSGLLHPLQPPSLLAVEPPTHTRYRKTVASVFTPRAVGQLRERVQEAATSLLDGLAGEHTVDIVDKYCSQLPVTVIGDILGVPDSERQRVLEFGELAAPSLDMGLNWQQYLKVDQGLAGFDAWLGEHLRRLRQSPGHDLMSQLIEASEDGAHLDEAELRATAGLVLAAGFETTVNLLGNGIRMLLDAPDQLAKLTARPELWPNAVEEILRLDSPVQMSARVARKDTEVGDTLVRRGEIVVLYLAAANRDPAVFDDPERFDVERPNASKHLSFSGGRHFCLGAALARAEGEVGLRTFFERYPGVRLTGRPSRRDTRVLRGWATLPVTLDEVRASVDV